MPSVNFPVQTLVVYLKHFKERKSNPNANWQTKTTQPCVPLGNQSPGHAHRNKVLTRLEKTISKIFYQAAKELHFIY